MEDTLDRVTGDALFGVLYAEDFDVDETMAPAAEPALEPALEPLEVVDPVFSAADLAAARDEARIEGRVEAERGLVASRTRMVELIATGLGDAHELVAAIAESRAEAIARLMLQSLAACLPALCRQHGAGELRALVQAVLPDLVDEPRITVRVSPHMASAIGAEIAAFDPDLAERIVVTPTDSIAPGDARITWQDGHAIRDAGQVRRTLEDALAALGLFEREKMHA